jgi:hypothetical protein
MMLTDLATVLLRADLQVVEVAGWRTRGHGQMKDVRGVTCHHTGSGRGTGTTLGLGTIVGGRPGLEGPLAHLYLNRAGVFYVVAAGLCYHAGVSHRNDQTNPYRIGIEALAAGDGWAQDFPKAQVDAYALGCKALADHYGFSIDQVLGHKETAAPTGRKVDPRFPNGMSMNQFRDLVRNARKPAPKPAPPKQEVDVAKLDPDDYNKIADTVWNRRQEITKQAPGGALTEIDGRTTGGDLPSIMAAVKALTAKVDKLIEQHAEDPEEPPVTPGQ